MSTKKCNKKKILFLITKLVGGGAEKTLIDLLRNFDYTRYSVSLFVIYPGGVYWHEIPKQVHVIVLFNHLGSLYRKSFRYYRKYRNTWLFSYLIHIRIKWRYDVIISFLEGLPLFLHTLILSNGKKNITWVHCDLLNFRYTVPEAFLNNVDEKKAYSSVDEIVFVSKNVMMNFSNLYDVDTPRRYLYNLIDESKINQLKKGNDKSKDKFTIITVGRLTEVKGYDKLIRVAKLFKEAGYDLCFQIIGEGEEKNKLEKNVAELNLQGVVFFLGFQSNPYTYMASSDIFISTSLSEGMPRVICEAFVLGLPVVATKSAGAMELLEDGRFGILVEHDEYSIFDGLKSLIDNEDMRKSYQQRSKERACMFDVQQVMTDLYMLF